MEEFDKLLEKYMDDEDINFKKNLDKVNNTTSLNVYTDMKKYREYSITINEFIEKYLGMNLDIERSTLTHKSFKSLTVDNPLVVGIPNAIVDMDEVIKGDYIVVKDCFGNYGSYLNPNHLRDLTKQNLIKNQLKVMKKTKIKILSEVTEFFTKIKELTDEYDYLTEKCSNYISPLEKANKLNTIKAIEDFIKKHGEESLDIDIESKKGERK